MARREEHHHQQQQQQQRQIHYASIMPSNATTATNGNRSNESSLIRKQTELERAKAVREFFI
jgi:hypothetical protein